MTATDTTVDQADYLAIEEQPATPSELPDWLDTDRELLSAVMAHPPEEIVSAIEETGSADLSALLAALDPTVRQAAELTAIAAEVRAIARTRRTSLLPRLADRLDALTHTTIHTTEETTR